MQTHAVRRQSGVSYVCNLLAIEHNPKLGLRCSERAWISCYVIDTQIRAD